MLTVVDKREQIRIFVTGDAKKVIESFADRFDMKEQGVASRIYNWFGTLPLPVQKWVVGLTDGDEGKGMKMFAKFLLEGDAKIRSIPFENQAPAAHDQTPGEQPEHTAGGRGGKKSR